MNAYELADWMENAIISDDWGELAKYYGWCNQHIPTMLRQQADRIAELEKALDWIATVNAMDYEYQDVAKSLLKERHGIK